ncbi:MAG: phosphodiesterase [Planctomycetaceae bacterium]|nr:MAG: phosphodiesterase [Planctomycetaceae bacterium]
MKILLISDLHANSVALSAIEEEFDVCLCLGDLVEYGVDPLPCIEWVRKRAHVAVRGNHDHSTVQRVQTSSRNECRRLAAATRELHARMLHSMHWKFLARLPVTRMVQIEGKTFYLVHATPRDPMDEYLGPDAAAWEQRLADIEADYVCVGHTHVPYVLSLPRCTVINPGSVGQPRDGDPRASYAVIENGQVTLKRVAYDVEAAVHQLQRSGLSDDLVEIASTILRTGGRLTTNNSAAQGAFTRGIG